MRATLAFLGRFSGPTVALLLIVPSPLAAQSSFGVDLLAGASFGSEVLGTTLAPSDGYFGLDRVDATATLGAGLAFPAIGLGIRPQVRILFALPADVSGQWVPCDPGFACPSIFLPAAARASRFEATAGVEVPILAQAGPVRPYATAGIGTRRYGISWDAIGEAGGIRLEAGSAGETDFVARFGIGVGLSLGSFEALVEGAADFSAFGAGAVPIPPESLALFAEPTIDLGRESMHEFGLSVGVRRYLP